MSWDASAILRISRSAIQVEVRVLHFDSVTGRVSLGTSRNLRPGADVDQR